MTQSDNYILAPGISQSMLKNWRFKSPSKWKSIYLDRVSVEEKECDSLTYGSLIDILLFTPERFTDVFHISDLPVLPSPAIKHILEATYERVRHMEMRLEGVVLPVPYTYDLEYHRDIALQCASEYKDGDKIGWYNNLTDDVKFNKLVKEQAYYDSLVHTGDRKIISKTMYEKAQSQLTLLQSIDYTKPYFVQVEGEILIHQLEISDYFQIDNDLDPVPIKGALDIVRICTKQQTIQVADLKTTSDAYNFKMSIRKYGYAFQQSYYDFLIRLWVDKHPEYQDYIILPPINIAIDSSDVPYIYQYSWNDLDTERYGNIDLGGKVRGVKYIKGWTEILKQIAWHMHHNKWSMPRELYENKKIIVDLQLY